MQAWARASASEGVHDWRRSTDHGGWMRRVRAMKLCGEDQTCCRITSTAEREVEIYRESIMAGRSVGTEAMYTVPFGRSWSREWLSDCHVRRVGRG
jgi:hypothetical protein